MGTFAWAPSSSGNDLANMQKLSFQREFLREFEAFESKATRESKWENRDGSRRPIKLKRFESNYSIADYEIKSISCGTSKTFDFRKVNRKEGSI